KRILHAMIEFVDQNALQFFGALFFRDVARDLRGADDLAALVVERRDGERNIDAPPVLGDAHRFKMIDVLAARDLPQDRPLLVLELRRDEAIAWLADYHLLFG